MKEFVFLFCEIESWFLLWAFSVFASRLDFRAVSSLPSHCYASLQWWALSHCLISFVLIPRLSPVPLPSLLSFFLSRRSLASCLPHTLILSDVKLITVSLCLPASISSRWCESDYSRWCMRCVCVCARMWEWRWRRVERQFKGQEWGAATDGGVGVSSFISCI